MIRGRLTLSLLREEELAIANQRHLGVGLGEPGVLEPAHRPVHVLNHQVHQRRVGVGRVLVEGAVGDPKLGPRVEAGVVDLLPVLVRPPRPQP